MMAMVFCANKTVLFLLCVCLVLVTVRAEHHHEQFYVNCLAQECNQFRINCTIDVECIDESDAHSCGLDYKCVNEVCCVDCSIPGMMHGCYCSYLPPARNSIPRSPAPSPSPSPSPFDPPPT